MLRIIIMLMFYFNNCGFLIIYCFLVGEIIIKLCGNDYKFNIDIDENYGGDIARCCFAIDFTTISFIIFVYYSKSYINYFFL